MTAAGAAWNDAIMELIHKGVTDMEKIICVLYVDPIDSYPKSDPGSPLKIDLYPGVQKVPAAGSESAADDNSIFSPNLDLALP
jgi:hypothetical protein